MIKKLELRKLCPKFRFTRKNLTRGKIKKHSKSSNALSANPDCNSQIKQTLRFLG